MYGLNHMNVPYLLIFVSKLLLFTTVYVGFIWLIVDGIINSAIIIFHTTLLTPTVPLI